MSLLHEIGARLGFSVVHQALQLDEETSLDLFWKVRRFSPQDSVRLSALGAEVLMAAVPGEDQSQKDPEIAAAEAQAKAAMMASKAGELIEKTTAIVLAAVSAVSRDGVEWQAVQLVATMEEEDADAGRLYVGMLSVPLMSEIAHAAMAGPREARETLRSFRPGSGASNDRPAGKAVRPAPFEVVGSGG